jgi:hypothetical protein
MFGSIAAGLDSVKTHLQVWGYRARQPQDSTSGLLSLDEALAVV